MNKLLLPILALLISQAVFGQTSAAFEREANKQKAEGNYVGAMHYFGKMLEIDSSDAKGLEGYAESARMAFSLEEAELTYQKIFDGKVKTKDPRATFWLASIKQDNGKYAEAVNYYEAFLANPTTADTSYLSLSKRQISRCKYNIGHVGDPDDDIKIEELPSPVNSPEGEYSPYLLKDVLYFSTNRDTWTSDPAYPERQLWKIYTNTNSSAISETAAANFNEKDLGTANATFSKDGITMYYQVMNYVGKTARFESRLYKREKGADGEFSNPMPLPESVNGPAGSMTMEPSIGWDAAGNETLFFVSNREGGRGKMDIWFCPILKDGGFGNTENLEALNTTGDDVTPNWHSQSRTLYFSTDGRSSLGGLDVFKSEKKGNVWQPAVHLPSPVNTNYNDAYYWLLPDESAAYFCTNRPGKQYAKTTACCYDIYKAENQGIELLVVTFNKKTKDSLSKTTIRLIEIGEKGNYAEEIKLLVPGNHHSFQIRRNREYLLIADKPDFTSDTTRLKTDTPGKRFYKEHLELQPAIVDLTALVFDKKTGLELAGCTMSFREISGGNRSEVLLNEKGNSWFYTLDFDRKYELTVTKKGWSSQTVVVSTQGFDRLQTRHLLEKLYLQRVDIESYLPLSLFFDNDEPVKRTMATKTALTYGQSWVDYHNVRQPVFLEEWAKYVASQQSQVSGISMQQFFKDSVKAGYDNLQLVCEALALRLQGGESVILEVQGFASKRASGPYNKALTSRRIWSVKNHFADWGGTMQNRFGPLKPYMDAGKLTFREVPNGESTSLETDDYEDIKNELKTIYSVRSSRERRVYIRNFIFSGGPSQQNPSQSQQVPAQQIPSQQKPGQQH